MPQIEPASFLRFLLAGAANTAFTGVLLVVIATQVDIAIAYTIVYVLGLTFTTVVSARFVFRSSLTVSGIARFVAWYLCVYLVGVSLVGLVAHDWHLSHALTAVAVLTLTVPLNFIGGSLVFRPRSTTPTSPNP
jgi:putative flippase GtrA